jgi:hypothetical protein
MTSDNGRLLDISIAPQLLDAFVFRPLMTLVAGLNRCRDHPAETDT